MAESHEQIVSPASFVSLSLFTELLIIYDIGVALKREEGSQKSRTKPPFSAESMLFTWDIGSPVKSPPV